MSQNILGLNPYQPHPIQQITQKIIEILQKFQTKDSAVQIEFKYAQFVSFCNSFYQKAQVPENIKQKVNQVCGYFVLQQNQLHLDTIKKLSYTNLILLNQLGQRVYKIQAGFDQKTHNKFYKMRQFLINLCKQNKQNEINGINFYSDVQKIPMNKTIKMINKSQIRFDVNIKQGQHSGRYSYDAGTMTWSRTRKQSLVTDFDLMMVQKLFRLAIKREQQVVVSIDEVLQALNSQKVGGAFLRFKRALRVSKNNEVEIALSQIYQPDQERRNQCLEDLKDIIQYSPQQLNTFCINIFQQFYMWEPKPNENISFIDSISKYEIQSEFMPDGIKKIMDFHKKRQYRELERYIQTTLNDLYALYFVDHNVKKRQTNVLNDIIRKKGHYEEKFPQCRLENEYGTYMHNYIYQYMTSK